MIRFAAFAALAVNCIFLVSPATGNPFKVYNDLFERCRKVEMKTLHDLFPDTPNTAEIKSFTTELAKFGYEPEREAKCLRWIINESNGNFDDLGAILYIHNLALYFSYLIGGKVARFEVLEDKKHIFSKEEETLKQVLTTIEEFLQLIAMGDPYVITVNAIKELRMNAGHEEKEIEEDNETLLEIIGEKRKPLESYLAILYINMESEGFPGYFTQEKEKIDEINNLNNIFQKILPGYTLPVPTSFYLSDDDCNKLLSGIHGTNLLTPGASILESRPVKIIEALLSSVYVKGEKDTPAPASTSGSG